MVLCVCVCVSVCLCVCLFFDNPLLESLFSPQANTHIHITSIEILYTTHHSPVPRVGPYSGVGEWQRSYVEREKIFRGELSYLIKPIDSLR